MGDILHALPAITALRQAHPSWVIDWVVEPRWQALLAANQPQPTPLVNRLHFAPTKAWRKDPFSSKTLHEIKTLRADLRAAGYDAVLDVQGALRSAVIGRFAASRRIIGEDQPREHAARWLFTERVTTQAAHVIEQDVELASAVAGDDLHPVTPWLPIDSDAEAWADRGLGTGSGQPAILLNPGAGWGAKRWPFERYASVASEFAQRGFRVLVNAGPGEEPIADGIATATGGKAETVVPTLSQLIALTRRVSLVVAGDTGPLHLACALGRPVVGIYGPTDPSRNGPYGTRFKVLRSPNSRRDHTRRVEPEAGLLTIQSEDVLRAADEVLREGHPLLEGNWEQQ